MLNIITWLWQGEGRHFDPCHVNVMERMIARHMTEPYCFVCVTDVVHGFSRDVNVLPTPAGAARLAHLRSPEGVRFPSCYRRLWTLSAEAAGIFSERVLLTDIDVVILGDLASLAKIPGEFVGWYPYRDWGKRKRRFGGGIYVHTPGTRTAVYDEFIRDPHAAIRTARLAGYRGSDQAWISYKLCEKEPCFPRSAGIASVRDPGTSANVAPVATIVQFNGKTKPWESTWPWVKKAWSSY